MDYKSIPGIPMFRVLEMVFSDIPGDVIAQVSSDASDDIIRNGDKASLENRVIVTLLFQRRELEQKAKDGK